MQSFQDTISDITRNVGNLSAPLDYFKGRASRNLCLPDNVLLFHRESEQELKQRALVNHCHQRFVLIVNLQTKGHVSIDHVVFPLEPREMLLIFPFQFHFFLKIADPAINWLIITFESEHSECLSPLRLRKVKLNGEDWTMLDALLKHYLAPHTAAANQTVLHLGLLLESLKGRFENRAPSQFRQTSAEQELISKINHCLSEDVACFSSVSALADKLNYSERSLRSRFQELYAVKIGHYLRSYRMHRAMQFIQDTDLPLYLVSDKCGFSSLASFSRAIKSFFGEPPLAYRKTSGAREVSVHGAGE